VVGSATVIFAVVFGYLGLRQFWLFRVHAFDIGIFSQGTWLLSRFDAPFFVTIRGLPLFADHSSYILILLAPLAWVFPTPAMLIVVTVLALAATAPLAYVVARSAGAGRLLASATAILVLMHPAVQWNTKDSFHPEVLVIPLVVGAIALLQRNRDLWAVVAVIVALTAKEDVGLLIVPLGLVIAWAMGKRRTGLIITMLGASAFLVNFLILLPAWSPSGELLYSYRYASIGEGPVGIIAGLFTKPELWVEVATDPTRVGYVAAILLAMPLSLLSPRWLLAGVPMLLANVFTNHGYQYSIRYHYTAYLIVVVVIAAAYGAGRVDGWRRRWLTIGALVVMIVSAGFTWGLTAPITKWAASHGHQDQIRSILEHVPSDDSIAAWTTFVPHLSEREQVYLFPNPFTEFYYATPGAYGADGGDMPDPDAVDWVFVRTDSYDEFDALIQEIVDSGEWVVVADDDPFQLLRRRG
jgi:uncharacterized membrane protein